MGRAGGFAAVSYTHLDVYKRQGQIHVDVVGNEKVEAAVAIVIDEGAPCVPAVAFASHAGFLADIGEGSVSVVVIEDVLPEAGDDAILIVCPDKDAARKVAVRIEEMLG